MVDKWVFCSLNKSLDRQSFNCGVAELNDYLQRYASQNHRKGIATTFVALASTEDLQIAGYYSVSMAEITVEVLPIEFQKSLPRYPIPAMRVGRLAVDITRRGEGLAWTAGASHLPASGGVRGMRVSERLHPPTRRKGAASGRWAGVLAVRTNIHSLGES